jgi:hypothetical protein
MLAVILYILLCVFFWFQYLIGEIITQNIKFIAILINIKTFVSMLIITVVACCIRLLSQNPQPIYLDLLIFLGDPVIFFIIVFASLLCIVILTLIETSIDKQLNKDKQGKRLFMMVVLMTMYSFCVVIAISYYHNTIIQLLVAAKRSPEGQAVWMKFEGFLNKLSHVQPLNLLIDEVIRKKTHGLMRSTNHNIIL